VEAEERAEVEEARRAEAARAAELALAAEWDSLAPPTRPRKGLNAEPSPSADLSYKIKYEEALGHFRVKFADVVS
jgi:hypothetical protein